MLNPENLVKLANTQMPYGKYAGRVLLDLPEEYLLWMDKQGWPKGELGELLQLMLMIKADGSEGVLHKLRRGQRYTKAKPKARIKFDELGGSSPARAAPVQDSSPKQGAIVKRRAEDLLG